jgi:Kelch motif
MNPSTSRLRNVARHALLACLSVLVPACGEITITEITMPPTTNPSGPPGSFDLVSPAHGAVVTSTSPTLIWTSSAEAASYTLQISTTNTFVTTVVDQPGIVGTWQSPASGLLNSQVYWWRIVAVNALGTTTAVGAPRSFSTNAATFTFAPASLSFTTTEGGPNPADQVVQMTDTGGLGSGVTWTVVSNQPWLTVSPGSGASLPSQLTPLAVHLNATYQVEAWTGATSTTNAPAIGFGAWIGTSMMIWSGDPATGGKFYDPATDTWFGNPSVVNAPSKRGDFRPVWTGTELLVWGGLDAGTPLNTGARYNPVTDTWAPMSTVGAPLARFAYMAVWTGSRMIVWGGEQPGYNYFNTGGIYDPATDSWTGPTTMTNAPFPRAFSAAVWTGTRMLVWGGEDPSKFNTGYFYDPVTDAWTGTTSLNGALSARSHLAGAWTGREMIVWGGGSGGPHLNTGARYIPAQDRWSGPMPLAGAPAGRASFVAAWTGSRMIVWGGEINGTLTNTGGIYRPPIPAFGTYAALITVSALGPGGAAVQTIPVAVTVN